MLGSWNEGPWQLIQSATCSPAFWNKHCEPPGWDLRKSLDPSSNLAPPLPSPGEKEEGAGKGERDDGARGVAGVSDSGRVSVAPDLEGQRKNMSKPSENILRIGASRPTTQLAAANPRLYHLYTSRCIARSHMSPVEAAYRNAQYESLGIKARWVRKSGTGRGRPFSAPPRRLEGLLVHCSLQLPLEGNPTD